MDYLKLYEKKYGDVIPLYEIMGNEIFEKKFHCDTEAVYYYCLENNKTWQEVLDFKYEPNVLY